MSEEHVPIEELDLLAIYEDVADEVWDVASKWDSFKQKAVSEQLARAVDSVNANLVEGDGRYTIADSLRFFIISRGSARESRLWLRRAVKRGFIQASKGEHLIEELVRATKLLNLLSKYRRNVSLDVV